MQYDDDWYEKEFIKKIDADISEPEPLFNGHPAYDWLVMAKNMPNPMPLFDNFWLKGELGILFADTNMGKSLLAVQIADSITRNAPINGFKMEVEPQPVLYFDFELTPKQFANRYSSGNGHHNFSPDFIRLQVKTGVHLPEGLPYDVHVFNCIKNAIVKYKSSIIIIDNITWLKDEMEQSQNASDLMKRLNELKKQWHVSILILAHQPKRDRTKPLSIDDLQGSKMLSNFADSVFTIGFSNQDTNIRYFKQLKVRSAENLYGAENVCICRIEKLNHFLGFQFMDYGVEYHLLRTPTDSQREQEKEMIIAFKEENPDMSIRKMEIALGIDRNKIQRVLKKHNEEKNKANKAN